MIYLVSDKKLYKREDYNLLVAVRSPDETRLMYDELVNKNNVREIYFYNENKDDLFEFFTSMFRVIEAAGGLVNNKEGKWLFIFRNGKWDLPKGKVEKGEGIKEAAIREVEEECGVRSLNITKELLPTYHTYLLKEKAVLKKSYWFEMDCEDDSKLVPQLEEGITDVKWFSKNDIQQKVINNTFESIKDVIKTIK